MVSSQYVVHDEKADSEYSENPISENVNFGKEKREKEELEKI
jgi:hypothetical protein